MEPTAVIEGHAAEPNPFGYVDHRPFTGFRSELVYGQRLDGALLHVTDAARGLACECICPACGEMLIAYKGRIKVPYFGHQRGGVSGCGRGAETNAHIWAKEVLHRRKRVWLPAVEATICRRTKPGYPEQEFRFENARLEKKLGDLVPDVVLVDIEGREVIVEVRVTHPCGDEKIAKLRERGWTAIEIDLRDHRRSTDRAAIERALFRGAPREWLFNRKQDALHAELERELKHEADRAAEREARRVDAAIVAERRAAATERQRVSTRATTLIAAAREASSLVEQQRADLFEPVGPSSTQAPRLEQPCFGFVVHATEWQATLFRRCIDDPELSMFPIGVSVARAIAAVEDCIHPAFIQEPEPAVLAAMQALGLSGSPPQAAVERYLDHLAFEGLLEIRAGGGYRFSDEHAASLHKRQVEELERERRRRSVDRAMTAIVTHLDVYEQAVFDADAWRAKPLPGSSLDLAAIVDAGGPAWDRLDAALFANERMLGGGPPAHELLGLPLAAHLRVATEREKLRDEGARGARRATLRARATVLLGPETDDWLSRDRLEGGTAATIAEQDDAGLALVMSALEQAGHERAMRLRAEDRAAKCRAELETAAKGQLGIELGSMFMRNHEPLLGDAPGHYCVDERTLRESLAVLARRQSRSRIRPRR